MDLFRIDTRRTRVHLENAGDRWCCNKDQRPKWLVFRSETTFHQAGRMTGNGFISHRHAPDKSTSGKCRRQVVLQQRSATKVAGVQIGNDISPSWSHDGKWIYFASTRAGQEYIWKMPATGGAATKISDQSGWCSDRKRHFTKLVA